MASRRFASLAFVYLFAAAARGASSPQTGTADVSGEWELTTMIFGNPLSERLTLTVENGKLTGKSSGKDVTGTVEGDRIQFESKDQDGTKNVYEGRLKDGKLSGTLAVSEEPWGQTPALEWSARRPAAGQPPPPPQPGF